LRASSFSKTQAMLLNCNDTRTLFKTERDSTEFIREKSAAYWITRVSFHSSFRSRQICSTVPKRC